jgi:hypothetical protein
MPALHHSQKRPAEKDNAVERQEQKLKTFAENSAWTLSGENRLEEFDFGQNDSKNNEKLEKNSDLVQNEGVDTKKFLLSILESGKSKEEVADLLAPLIDPIKAQSVSQTNTEFQAAALAEVGSQQSIKRRPKWEPENFAVGTVEYELAVVRKNSRERAKRSRELKAIRKLAL